MGGWLRGGRRGFGSGGRAFNGAAILTRHLVAFSTRQWRRCRLGSRPPSAGRAAHCSADRTGLPGKGRELRREQGALGRGRAPSLASGGRARAAAARETWPFAWRHRPPSLREAPAPLGQWRAAETSGLGRCGRLLGRPRRAEGRTRRRLRDPLAGLPPAIFRASPREPGRSPPPLLFRRGPSPAGAALRSRPEAAGRPRPPVIGASRANAPPSPAPSPVSGNLRPRIECAVYY